MPKPTVDQLYDKRGHFVNTETGEAMDPPEGWAPILAGPWPNRNPGALRAPCWCCFRPVGMSPKGWLLHQADPEMHPIFCEACMKTLIDVFQQLEEEAPSPPGT